MLLAFDDISTDPVKLLPEHGIEVAVLRLDKIHPVISGNKWFKLQYYLKEAKEQDKKRIITFGGAWSNHIVATAAACQMNNLESIGIIRGEEPISYSPTLLQATEYGMQLHFISREEYAEKKIPASLMNDENYLINEGGFGQKGAEGAAAILNYTKKDFTHCCCAVGTGTMMAGLTMAVAPGQQLIGISVLKNNYQLNESVRSLVADRSKKWEIIHDYHFGGYAKHKPALIEFMNDFYRQTGIPSDFVYTGKLFYAVNDLAKQGFFPAGSRLLLIHSGGLQGNKSLEKGTLIF
ncbi:MAG TPA: pyridoxal-phosphate dependent enzyme [Chitinophagaceae bacterium]